MRLLKFCSVLMIMSCSQLFASGTPGSPYGSLQQSPTAPMYTNQQYQSQSPLQLSPQQYHCPPDERIGQGSFVTVNVSPQDIQNMQEQINRLENSYQVLEMWKNHFQGEGAEQERTALSQRFEKRDRILRQRIDSATNPLSEQLKAQQAQITILQQQLGAQQSQLMAFQQQIINHGNPQPSVIVNTNNSATATATTTQQTENVSTIGSRFYGAFFNVQTLLSTIIVLTALVQAGPKEASGIALLAATILLCINKEALERFKRKCAIGLTGTGIAVMAGLVVMNTKDKELMGLAMITLPVSLGTTAFLLAAE